MKTSEEEFEKWFQPYLRDHYLVECNFGQIDLPPSIARQCATDAFIAGIAAGQRESYEENARLEERIKAQQAIIENYNLDMLFDVFKKQLEKDVYIAVQSGISIGKEQAAVIAEEHHVSTSDLSGNEWSEWGYNIDIAAAIRGAK